MRDMIDSSNFRLLDTGQVLVSTVFFEQSFDRRCSFSKSVSRVFDQLESSKISHVTFLGHSIVHFLALFPALVFRTLGRKKANPKRID